VRIGQTHGHADGRCGDLPWTLAVEAHQWEEREASCLITMNRARTPCANTMLVRFCRRGASIVAAEKAASVSGRANGSDVKLHGQGPRAEARAARGALHVRRANARRVTP
jgi:hypothetical protein